MPSCALLSESCWCKISKCHITQNRDQPHEAVKITESQSHFLNILHPLRQEATQ